MSRKQPLITADHPETQVLVRPASIQYLRTGRRRPTAPEVGTVHGVQPFFA
jgi:hypothetical protein